MKTVGVFEAKAALPRLLDAVEQGECVVITSRGKPVARLEPARSPEADGAKAGSARVAPRRRRTPAEIKAILADAREFRRKHPLRGVTLRELIDDGRQR